MNRPQVTSCLLILLLLGGACDGGAGMEGTLDSPLTENPTVDFCQVDLDMREGVERTVEALIGLRNARSEGRLDGPSTAELCGKMAAELDEIASSRLPEGEILFSYPYGATDPRHLLANARDVERPDAFFYDPYSGDTAIYYGYVAQLSKLLTRTERSCAEYGTRQSWVYPKDGSPAQLVESQGPCKAWNESVTRLPGYEESLALMELLAAAGNRLGEICGTAPSSAYFYRYGRPFSPTPVGSPELDRALENAIDLLDTEIPELDRNLSAKVGCEPAGGRPFADPR